LGTKITATQSLDLSSKTDLQDAASLISNTNTQTIALQTLPRREREPSSLIRLKRVRQGIPTGFLTDAYRIENRNPIKPLMTEPMTQSCRNPTTDCIAMTAHHGRTPAMTQHQPLAPPLIHANQIVPKLTTSLDERHKNKQQN
jgi:hypothetical protein